MKVICNWCTAKLDDEYLEDVCPKCDQIGYLMDTNG
jgi:phage FluMu protein Com